MFNSEHFLAQNWFFIIIIYKNANNATRLNAVRLFYTYIYFYYKMIFLVLLSLGYIEDSIIPCKRILNQNDLLSTLITTCINKCIDGLKLRMRFWNLSNSRNVVAHAKLICDDDIMMFCRPRNVFVSSYLFSLYLFKTDNNFHHLQQIWHVVIFRFYSLSYWAILRNQSFFSKISWEQDFTQSRIQLHCISDSEACSPAYSISVKWRTSQVTNAHSTMLNNYIKII